LTASKRPGGPAEDRTAAQWACRPGDGQPGSAAEPFGQAGRSFAATGGPDPGPRTSAFSSSLRPPIRVSGTARGQGRGGGPVYPGLTIRSWPDRRLSPGRCPAGQASISRGTPAPAKRNRRPLPLADSHKVPKNQGGGARSPVRRASTGDAGPASSLRTGWGRECGVKPNDPVSNGRGGRSGVRAPSCRARRSRSRRSWGGPLFSRSGLGAGSGGRLLLGPPA